MNTTQRKHILFLTRWYPNRSDSMFGLFVQRHGQAIALYDDVSVIYIHPVNEKIHSETVIQHHKGLHEYRLYISKKGLFNKFRLPFRFFIGIFRLFRKIVDDQGVPDLTHVHILTRMGLAAWILKKRYGIPYIITEHWSRYLPHNFSYRGFLRKQLTQMVVREAEALTAVTSYLMDAMKKQGLHNKRFEIIPNVVDTDFFRPADHLPPAKEKTLLHISCFEEKSKNMSGILRVMKKLRQHRDDVRLVMVGTGIDYDKTITQAKNMNLLDNSVFFTGLLEGKELLRWIQQADVMILFSHYETQGIVLLEGFACGIPAISSDVGGVSEHLLPEHGMLVPPADEEAMVEKINQILNNPNLFDKEMLRNYAVSHFSYQQVGRRFHKLYTDLIT
jgi:glycosyltransferase involved in cell wall biosynthesis